MKILLIDDSSLSRRLLKRSLGPEYSFIEAENGMRGLELYYLEKPDIVFLDLNMPNMNGMEVLEQLRQIDPDAQIVIGSADVQDYTREQAMNNGAVAYINKPFVAEEVQGIIQQIKSRGEE
jgi:two-component system, chemotaxis family, chemotaxis protein CheY